MSEDARTNFATVVRVMSLEPHPDADRLDLLTLGWPLTAAELAAERSRPAIGLGELGAPGTRIMSAPITWSEVRVVTGKHYVVGQLGFFVAPGCVIPGWLAKDMWLVGKKRARDWFEVRELEIRGQLSAGLFHGRTYAKDGSRESEEHFEELRAAGGRVDREGRIFWPLWLEDWLPGTELDAFLGLRWRGALAVAHAAPDRVIQ